MEEAEPPYMASYYGGSVEGREWDFTRRFYLQDNRNSA